MKNPKCLLNLVHLKLILSNCLTLKKFRLSWTLRQRCRLSRIICDSHAWVALVGSRAGLWVCLPDIFLSNTKKDQESARVSINYHRWHETSSLQLFPAKKFCSPNIFEVLGWHFGLWQDGEERPLLAGRLYYHERPKFDQIWMLLQVQIQKLLHSSTAFTVTEIGGSGATLLKMTWMRSSCRCVNIRCLISYGTWKRATPTLTWSSWTSNSSEWSPKLSHFSSTSGQGSRWLTTGRVFWSLMPALPSMATPATCAQGANVKSMRLQQVRFWWNTSDHCIQVKNNAICERSFLYITVAPGYINTKEGFCPCKQDEKRTKYLPAVFKRKDKILLEVFPKRHIKWRMKMHSIEWKFAR